jgi:hypothetical protein
MICDDAGREITPVFIYFQNLLKAILKRAVSADISNVGI